MTTLSIVVLAEKKIHRDGYCKHFKSDKRFLSTREETKWEICKFMKISTDDDNHL